jgi:hypothetical protein
VAGHRRVDANGWLVHRVASARFWRVALAFLPDQHFATGVHAPLTELSLGLDSASMVSQTRVLPFSPTVATASSRATQTTVDGWAPSSAKTPMKIGSTAPPHTISVLITAPTPVQP